MDQLLFKNAPELQLDPAAVLPNLDHAYSNLEIYQPSDDTFLFIDTLLKEKTFINQQLKPRICFEIGGGNINHHAAAACRQTFEANDLASYSDIALTDLNGCFEARLQNKVDVLLFNPPYVVTPSSEIGLSNISAAWAGGKNGRQVIDRLLPKLKHFISPKGCVYLLLIVENRPSEIIHILQQNGFDASIISKRQAFNERLMILKAVKRCDTD